MYQRNFPYLAWTALESARRVGPVDILRGSVSALLGLAFAAQQRGWDAGHFDIGCVGTNSYEVSPRTRRILSTAFDVAPKDIVDAYSLSEFSTAAMPCEHCDGWHFDQPPILPELLSLTEDRTLGCAEELRERLLGSHLLLREWVGGGGRLDVLHIAAGGIDPHRFKP